MITVSTLLDFSWVSDAIGNPGSTAFATNVFMNKAFVSTFFDRLKSTFIYHLTKYRFYQLTEKAQTEAMRKYLSPNMPNIREVERNVALMFTNYHHTLYGVKPFTPGVIPIGGIHAEQNDDQFSPVSLLKCLYVTFNITYPSVIQTKFPLPIHSSFLVSSTSASTLL